MTIRLWAGRTLSALLVLAVIPTVQAAQRLYRTQPESVVQGVSEGQFLVVCVLSALTMIAVELYLARQSYRWAGRGSA